MFVYLYFLKPWVNQCYGTFRQSFDCFAKFHIKPVQTGNSNYRPSLLFRNILLRRDRDGSIEAKEEMHDARDELDDDGDEKFEEAFLRKKDRSQDQRVSLVTRCPIVMI